MQLHYKGKYDLNPESLPCRTHKPGAIRFKEPKDSKAMGLIANTLALLLMIPLGIILYWRCGFSVFESALWACLLSILLVLPHEFLHVICFKEDVYLYTNLKHGMLFVTGTETMSKVRFIFMSFLPNLVLGFIPYIIALIIPSLNFLGVMGLMMISMGAGDYINIFNAAIQMPKGSRTYIYQFNSYWYIPTEDNSVNSPEKETII